MGQRVVKMVENYAGQDQDYENGTSQIQYTKENNETKILFLQNFAIFTKRKHNFKFCLHFFRMSEKLRYFILWFISKFPEFR